MGLSRQEYWSGLPFPSPGDLSDPGIEPTSFQLYIYTCYIHTHIHTHMWSVYAQLCLTDCHPMGCSPLGSSVHGTSQARILEWVDISFSGALRDTGIEPASATSPPLAGGVLTTSTTWEALYIYIYICNFLQ